MNLKNKKLKKHILLFLFFILSFVSFGQIISEEGSSADTLEKEIQSEFQILEKSALPKGGYPNFYAKVNKKLGKKMKPADLKFSGVLYVQFVILEDGSIDQNSVKTLSKAEVEKLGALAKNSRVIDDKSYSNVVEKVIKSMPDWIPGELKGEKTKQRIVLPIAFKL